LRHEEAVDGSVVARRGQRRYHAVGLGDLTRNARIVISFVILLYIRYDSDDVLYRLPLGKMTSVDVWASTLSFLATMSVTLVLGCERP